jgi:hypothetical protein
MLPDAIRLQGRRRLVLDLNRKPTIRYCFFASDRARIEVTQGYLINLALSKCRGDFVINKTLIAGCHFRNVLMLLGEQRRFSRLLSPELSLFSNATLTFPADVPCG